MANFVARRLLQAVPVVLLASIFVFALLQIVPGDPAVSLAGPQATDAEVRTVRDRLGLNRPMLEQYFTWAGRAVRGNLGTSFRGGQPVLQQIRQSAEPTIELTLAAFLIEVTLGVALGVLAGMHVRSGWDWFLTAFTTLGIAIPHFVLGLVLLYLLSFRLGWFPVGGQVPITENFGQGLRSLVLPASVLGVTGAAVLARFVRSSMAQVMSQDFVRTARAKGLREGVVMVRHALRNSLIPVITVIALQFAGLLAGSVVIENVFSRPGLGRLVVNAIQGRDYPVVQGTLLVLVGIFVLVNLVADLLYGVIDPRIRLS